MHPSSSSPSKSTTVVCFESIDSTVGPLIVGATDKGVCLLEFSDPQRRERQLRSLQRTFDARLEQRSHPLLDSMRAQLAEYFAGMLRTFDLPLDFRGTPFQIKVWETLLEIPYGDTWSYKQVAVRTGDPDASRAVGTANGLNRIAVVIPCHRVVNSDGSLGGYGGGLHRKQSLLDLERGQRQLF
jgi:AraC family transcriptional regulator, regulatory protein of adaptative response / methylated-DNA-[protein]-cysteine methyltransferase